jgi:hypothetical protein
MTTDKKDEMIEAILAGCNVAMATTAASAQLEMEMVVECEISKEDFVWSSR